MSTISSTSSTFSFNTNNLATEFAQQSNATESGGNLTAADCANLALTLNSQGNSDANFWATMADGGSNGASLVSNTGFSLSDLAGLASVDGNNTNVTYADLTGSGASNFITGTPAAEGTTISTSQLQTTAGTTSSSSTTNQLLETLLSFFMQSFEGQGSSGGGLSSLFGSSGSSANPYGSEFGSSEYSPYGSEFGSSSYNPYGSEYGSEFGSSYSPYSAYSSESGSSGSSSILSSLFSSLGL